MAEQYFNKLNNIASPIVLLIGGGYALYQQFSLGLMLTMVGLSSVFILLNYHTWKSKENNIQLYKWINITKNFLLTISFILSILLAVLSFIHSSFPKWNSEFTVSHFLKDDEIKELRPYKFNSDSVSAIKRTIFDSSPYLLIKNEGDFLVFQNEKIIGELIRYGNNDIRNFCNAILAILFIFTIFLILLDKVPYKN